MRVSAAISSGVCRHPWRSTSRGLGPAAEGGVEGAWLDQGKQFSQNYRWSFDFVKWRLNPDPCEKDTDNDGDVDGMDLYNLTAGFTSPELEEFALDYGRKNCTLIEQ